MPVEYHIDHAAGIVRSRGWGVVTAEDLAGHGRGLLADPDFRPELRQLWDLAEVTDSPMTFNDLTALAGTNYFAPTSRRALLAPIDVSFGVARMFQMLRESKGERGIRVFRDRAAALRWLETGEEPEAR